MDNTINFDKDFIINKSRIKYVTGKQGNKCVSFCKTGESLARIHEYTHPARDPSCFVKKKISKKMLGNTNDKIVKDIKQEHNQDSEIYYTVFEDCEYANIYDIDFSKLTFQLDLFPNIVTTDTFLIKVYDIDSNEKFTNIIKDDNLSLITRLRICDALIQTQTNIFDISDPVVEFFSQIIKQLWVNDIYPNLYMYIYVDIGDENTIYLKKNSQDIEYYYKEKMNYFITKFASNSRIYDFLTIYSKYYKKKIDSMQNKSAIISTLKKKYFDYVIKKIQSLL